MNFNSLKDVNNLKLLLKSIGNDIVEAFKSVKDVNVEKFKKGFNVYFVDYLKSSYANIDGRIGCRQYWMFALYSILVSIALQILVIIFPSLAVLGLLYSLAILVPSIGLGVCRLHDINLSGWFFLIAVIPYIGFFALVFLFCIPSDKQANNYGPEAK